MNKSIALLAGFLTAHSLPAHDFIFDLPAAEVSGRADPMIGQTVSAAQGLVNRVDLQYRPLLRTGEVLEAIPGFIATQHSGSGKGNQYFLRGFNLDHGTDFATFVEGMPVNLPTHGHGQGYSDINFIIPELVDTIEYMKGPYYAAIGDFSSSGAGQISLVNHLDQGLAVLNVGEDSFLRGVLATTAHLGAGQLLAGFESQYYDGPWEIGENLNKFNALLKYTHTGRYSRYGITFMGYDSEWDSADQIPLRAVREGPIDRLGSLDQDLGGDSSRFSLSGSYTLTRADRITQANLYAIYYDLSLWSNFTYFLDDPLQGDEFEQLDERMIYGGNISQTFYGGDFAGKPMRQTIGFQARYDDIDAVGLYRTASRKRVGTIREDTVGELSAALFYENEIQWTDQLKSILGIRGDYYFFDVESNLAANSGDEEDSRISPKLSLVYSPHSNLELFLSAGLGFHSNDARGTTITVDPTDGVTPAPRVDPLVQSKGAELGSRITWNNQLNTSLSLWYLELDSELLFVGDAGITEPSRPSNRRGLEIANYYRPNDFLTFELDAAVTRARFSDDDPAGDSIPGALESVLSTAITARSENGWVGSLRLRYFGPRALIEDDSVDSGSSTVVNLRTGFEADNWSIFLDVLNLFDSNDHDITYYYASRLPGEPAEGVEDIHFHPLEPRTARLYFRYRF